MKDYASMSDFEINCRVHAEVMAIAGLDSFKAKDYCNNPADAWPIITENKICLIPEIGDGTWWAMYQPIIQLDWRVYDNGKPIENNANPLRAAMIVFLRMKEGEK